jgi:hypothetical protein
LGWAALGYGSFRLVWWVASGWSALTIVGASFLAVFVAMFLGISALFFLLAGVFARFQYYAAMPALEWACWPLKTLGAWALICLPTGARPLQQCSLIFCT